MRSRYTIPPWKSAPFVRLIAPLFSGVLLQAYQSVSILVIAACLATSITAYCTIYLFKLSKRFKLRIAQGVLIQLTIFFIGCLITWNNDIRNHKTWFGHTYADNDYLIVSLEEPLVKKEKTYKANATVTLLIRRKNQVSVNGKIILYFIDTPQIQYGDRLLLKKPLQKIKNTGNPAAFDYARYAGFQQQFHTVFLKPHDYVILEGQDKNNFTDFIFRSREYILASIKKYVSQEKSIGGIAEALLIGYKHDLDKDLMQAYSNTGVVHIIAISGLHLGLIYVMLSWLMNVLPWIKKIQILKVLIILGSLWLFSILTGSSASVLRSALMFSCILIGKTYFTQASVYNAIAASAFMLVCYNPYLLWDVGFQLSYLAVLGIVWLQRPILKLVYIKNRWLHKVWSMVAVTLAAQLAAFPLCLYYFHQFPNLFLITNLLAVPLSTVILFAEIFLMCFSWLEVVAVFAGKIIYFLIGLMNRIIVYCNSLSWSSTDQIYADVSTCLAMYAVVALAAGWLQYRHRTMLKSMLAATTILASLHLYADVKSLQQSKLVVYNISKTQAIDFIEANSFYFIGDSTVNGSGPSYNFHIKPARIDFQARHAKDARLVYNPSSGLAVFKGRRILIIGKSIAYETLLKKLPIDVLIISRNPTLKISGLLSALDPRLVVFDASNSLWKIEQWKKECSALLLPFHSVPEQGAFVAELHWP